VKAGSADLLAHPDRGTAGREEDRSSRFTATLRFVIVGQANSAQLG